MSEITVRKLQDFAGHKQPVYVIDKDKNGDHIFSSGADGMVIRWNANSETPGQVIMRLGAASFALRYIDPGYLAVAENSYGIRILDLKSNRLIKSVALGKHFYFHIHTDGNLLYVADNAGNINVGDIHSDEPWKKYNIGTASIRNIASNAAGDLLALSMSDHSVRIMEKEGMKEIQKIDAHDRSVFISAFLTHNPWLLTAGKDAKIRVWSTAHDYKNAGEIPAHLYGINYLDVSPSGDHFLTCSMDKTIKLWDTHKGELLKVIDFARYDGHRTSINQVKWISHNQFVSSGDDRMVFIWEVEGLDKMNG